MKKRKTFEKKGLAQAPFFCYIIKCCGMIAMKREVAAHSCRCSVERMSSQETGDKSLYKATKSTDYTEVETTCENVTSDRGAPLCLNVKCMTHTGECTVTACRTQK